MTYLEGYEPRHRFRMEPRRKWCPDCVAALEWKPSKIHKDSAQAVFRVAECVCGWQSPIDVRPK